MPQRPIGFFDSGEGGLTVARAVAELLPGEEILYACDSAHFPYGPRPLPEVRRFFLRFAQFFADQGCKLVVIACNTATAAVLLSGPPPELPLPVLGVVEPGARAAVAATRNGRIGVVATQATVGAGVYPRVIAGLAPGARVVQQACPVLVTLAEQGVVESPEVREEVRRCLEPLLAEGIDTLVLGCTHLPHMQKVIGEVVGPEVRLVDPGMATAREVREYLARRGLLNPAASGGRLRFYTTGDPDRFVRVARLLWPGRVHRADHLPLWSTEAPPAPSPTAGGNPGG
ncbi:MAG: glutamate racemase [Firmicutes bacterium]|nr:glutamate racemase [Bacillota bacterium]